MSISNRLLGKLEQFPGLDVAGADSALAHFDRLPQPLAQEDSDFPGEVVLQREDFRPGPLQGLAPDLLAAARIDQRHFETEPVA